MLQTNDTSMGYPSSHEGAKVVIVGGGPTGLMLACELRLAHLDVLVLEQRAEPAVEFKANDIHARTLEVLDQRGILERFLAAGRQERFAAFSALGLDISQLETRHPYVLGIHQATTEALLEERAMELGVRLRRPARVVGLRQDEAGVEVEVAGPAGPEWLHAEYLVGCDGGHSVVRKLAGIDFPGTPATMTAFQGEVRLANPPSKRLSDRREHGVLRVGEGEPGWYRMLVIEFDHVADRDTPVTLEVLREACTRIAGTDFGMHSPRWITRFSDTARQAERYRNGRVLLAGDAAHIHFPAGGQGLNLGVQDAVNLGWKLALVLQGQVSEELLDSYYTERYPVVERVLDYTRAQTALMRPGVPTTALRTVFKTLIKFDEVKKYLGCMTTALDIRYPMGDGHSLLGYRVPDFNVRTPSGDTRMFMLMHTARPILLDFRGQSELRKAADGWADRVDLIEAQCQDDHWAVPAIGEVPVPAAILVRPDGYVAWIAPTDAELDTDSLCSALTTWFGPAH